MAYNPFDFFRRNQKIAFAALTIFVMFTFVLSFGQGDFFQWVPGWLRSLRSSGKVVMATVDGKNLYDTELTRVDENRSIADQFMQHTSNELSRKLATELQEESTKASDQLKQPLQSLMMSRRLLANPQGGGEQLFQFAMQSYQRADLELRSQLTNPTLKEDEKNLALKARTLIRLDQQQMSAARTGFFATVPLGRTNQDRFNFKLWLSKADKLGIKIRPEDAEVMVKEEFSNFLTKELRESLEKSFQGKGGFNRQALYSAIADEYRVRTALNIVLGQTTAHHASSPLELYRTYKQLCDEGKYIVMSVPAEAFLDKVTTTPSESELRELFDKYRSQEFDPTRETPGFRDPRKLKMAWVEIQGDEPAFRKIGEEVYKVSELGARLAPLGFGEFAPLTAAPVATVPEPRLQAAYKNYVGEYEAQIRSRWFPWGAADDRIIDTSVMRAENLGALLGTFVGSRMTGAHFMMAPLNAKEHAAQFERNDRARVMAALLAPSTVAGTNLLGNVFSAGLATPHPLPLSVVKPQLEVDERAKVTRTQVEREIENFMKELTRLGAKKDKSEARSYAEKFIRENGLKTGASAEFRDLWTIDEDPGLGILVQKKERGHGVNDAMVKLGPSFFDLDRNNGRTPSTISLFEPRTYPQDRMGFRLSPGEPSYLTWRTETVEASSPRQLDENKVIRAKVEAAWKLGKARELAKAAAEELRKKIDERIKEEKGTETGKVQAVVSDTHSKFLTEKFGSNRDAILRSKWYLQEKVSPVLLQRSFQGGGDQPVPFGMQHVIRKENPYPSPLFAQDLIENKDKPLGTSILQPDMSKNEYFVGVLYDRETRGTLDFQDKALLGTASQLGQAVQQHQQSMTLQQGYQAALALLKTEFKVANEHEKLKAKADGSD